MIESILQKATEEDDLTIKTDTFVRLKICWTFDKNYIKRHMHPNNQLVERVNV